MNKKQLKKIKGWVRIRPVPKIEINGNDDLPDLWFVENITDNYIRMSYLSTGHSKDIGLDHFLEYRTDSFVDKGRESKGMMIFKTQIIVNGKRVILEPLGRPPI